MERAEQQHLDAEGFPLSLPSRLGDIAACEDTDDTVRSVSFGHTEPRVRTNFRSASLSSAPQVPAPQLISPRKDVEEESALPVLARPLPKSAIFVLEPLSHFPIQLDDAAALSKCLAKRLAQLGCVIEADASARVDKWYCVQSSAFAYLVFTVSVYTDGHTDDGKGLFVVELQRRSGNISEFVALYHALRNAVEQTFEQSAAPPPEAMPRDGAERRRVMPLPPRCVVEQLGLDSDAMLATSVRDLLDPEHIHSCRATRIESLQAVASLCAEREIATAIASDEEVAKEAVANLVELLEHECKVTRSFAAHALASLSELETVRQYIVKCDGVPSVARAAVDGVPEDVGLRRGCGRILKNLAQTDLPLDSRAAIDDAVQHKEQKAHDPVLNGHLKDAEVALRLRCY
eukprot:scaffold64_cov248-Pinguiococcus_pyrenoidosus.AAC.14